MVVVLDAPRCARIALSRVTFMAVRRRFFPVTRHEKGFPGFTQRTVSRRARRRGRSFHRVHFVRLAVGAGGDTPPPPPLARAHGKNPAHHGRTQKHRPTTPPHTSRDRPPEKS